MQRNSKRNGIICHQTEHHLQDQMGLPLYTRNPPLFVRAHPIVQRYLPRQQRQHPVRRTQRKREDEDDVIRNDEENVQAACAVPPARVAREVDCCMPLLYNEDDSEEQAWDRPIGEQGVHGVKGNEEPFRVGLVAVFGG